MVHKEAEVRRRVYNLANETYYTWSSTGELIDLTVDHFALPRVARDGLNYIVTEDIYKKAKASGRPTNDLILVEDYGQAQSGVKLSRFVLYDNEHIRVYPIKGA